MEWYTAQLKLTD